VLNIDRDQAIKWFCTACKDDLRVAASRAAIEFFNCGIQSHAVHLEPIVRSMLDADLPEVVQEGAEEVAARWLFHGMFEEELNACHRGSTPQRKGIARVASSLLLDAKYADRCEELLMPLWDDTDAAVRKETRHAFYDKTVFSLPNARRMVARYIKSRAFADDPSPLIGSLKEFSGSLTPFSDLILMICEVFADSLRDASRDTSTGIAGDARRMLPMLLRLYEQAQGQGDGETVGRCLDAWDLLFEKRVGMTRDLTRAIEQ
jgi:hypothetical protein